MRKAAWLVLGLILAAPAAASPLDVKTPASGSLAAGGAATHPLEVAPGDYVQGRLATGETPLDLHLLGADGTPRRLLLDGATGTTTFRFVAAEAAMALRVAASGPNGGTYQLTLTRRVAAAEQAPPPRRHLSPTMADAAADLAAGRSIEPFWRAVVALGTPLVEPGPDDGHRVVTFLQRGAQRNVRLFGAPSGDHDWMERLGETDIWFKSFVVPSATRMSYMLAPDVPELPGTKRQRRVALLATARADPLNRHPWPPRAPDPFNQRSTLTLPDAPAQPGLTGAAPAGRFEHHRFASAILGNARRVTLYWPPGVRADDPRTLLLIVFDGRRYQSRIPTPAILDALVGEGRLPPVIAAFVPNPDPATRSRELPGNPDFARALATELVPWIKARTGLDAGPGRTVLTGSSYGGLAAATVALAHPEVFGNAVCLSGSFWWHPEGTPPDRAEYVAGLVARSAPRPVRFFLSAGLFEQSRRGTASILESGRHLRDVLEAKGYEVHHREYAGGHDYLVWRGALADGLLALFGRAD